MAAAACLTAAVAVASWTPAQKTAQQQEAARYASPVAAYRIGLAEWDFGRNKRAVRALEYAASKGVLGAQLKLADLYAHGKGVARSDGRAFAYYQAIADGFADINPRHPVAGYVADAFVQLAGYYRRGVKELEIKASPAHAVALYRHAASYFGNAEAQYALAQMYLEGEGVDRNERLGVNWLVNASRKQHAPSQAKLGALLWHGDAGLQRQPATGLALLMLAQRNAADTPALGWIRALREKILLASQEGDRRSAMQLVARWSGEPATGLPTESVKQGSGTGPDRGAPRAPSSGIMTVGAPGGATH
ncbi:MAG: hypothetical protein Kow0032_23200 [Methyloligellaceae bacterium]